jgi:hypothetical protein
MWLLWIQACSFLCPHSLKEDMTDEFNFGETVLSLLQPQLQSKETDEKHSSFVLLIVAQIQLASCQGPAS